MGTRRKRKNLEYNESDRLILFLYRMSQLEGRTYVRELKPRAVGDLSFDNPNGEAFDAFMLTFRHFYATNEPTHMQSIHGVLSKGARQRGNQTMIEELKKITETFEKSPRYRFDIYDKDPKVIHTRLSDDEIFDLYINCEYFHTDARGGGFFFQLPAQHRANCYKAFQLSLAKYIIRLRAYVPLVASTLSDGVFPVGRMMLDGGKNATFHFNVPFGKPPL